MLHTYVCHRIPLCNHSKELIYKISNVWHRSCTHHTLLISMTTAYLATAVKIKAISYSYQCAWFSSAFHSNNPCLPANCHGNSLHFISWCAGAHVITRRKSEGSLNISSCLPGDYICFLSSREKCVETLFSKASVAELSAAHTYYYIRIYIKGQESLDFMQCTCGHH